MRAKQLFENNKGLKIFKNKDNIYSAKRNDYLFTFSWLNPNIINFKKIGKVDSNYSINGIKIPKPPIQMIVKLQRKINDYIIVNEDITTYLKPKTKQEIKDNIKNITDPYNKWFYKFYYFLNKNLDIKQMEQLDIPANWSLYDYLNYYYIQWKGYFDIGLTPKEAAIDFINTLN